MNSLESFIRLLVIPCSLPDKFMEICHSNGPRGKGRWSERSDQSAEPKASDCPMKNKKPSTASTHFEDAHSSLYS